MPDLEEMLAPDERLSLLAAVERNDRQRFADVWFEAIKRIARTGSPEEREMVAGMLTPEGKRKLGL